MFSIVGVLNHSFNDKANGVVNLWTVSLNMPIGNCFLNIFKEISRRKSLYGKGEIENYSRVKGKESKNIQELVKE